jgi:predicted permease
MSQLICGENTNNGSNIARCLRIISVWTFIPAFAFNIAHRAAFDCSFPALGLIPHAFSAALAIYELGWWECFSQKSKYRIVLQNDQEEDGPLSLHPSIITILDAVFGFSLLSCIVCAYIEMEMRARWGNIALTVVGTYATLPYIVNAYVVHLICQDI